jgi:hypothetical protein
MIFTKNNSCSLEPADELIPHPRISVFRGRSEKSSNHLVSLALIGKI